MLAKRIGAQYFGPIDLCTFVNAAQPREGLMPATQSEKREYKSEDHAKRQQVQWEKKGYGVPQSMERIVTLGASSAFLN